ncbi:MAG: hypothetical protein KDI59_07935 [Xanthomonadales bacterium]|nr:hypothetical protein [Xanthomonadales bacterium]
MNKIKQIITISLFLILIGCSSEPELTKDQLLKQSIEQLEQRFEARKLGEIVEYVSKDYQDDSGRKYDDVKRVIQLQLMRHKTVHIFSVIKDIQWADDSNATVQITAAMAGKPITDLSLLPTLRADMLNFTVDFVLEDEVYKIQSASWTWATPTDFL